MDHRYTRAAEWEALAQRADGELEAWELYHENAKLHRYSESLPHAEVLARMAAMSQALPYDNRQAIELPAIDDAIDRPDGSLLRVMADRRTPDDLQAVSISPETLSALLHFTAGASTERGQPDRPYRMVPSAGALYPVELFVHLHRVEDIPPGVYYYDPLAHALRSVVSGDQTAAIASCLIQPNLASDTSLQVFSVGVFERSTFKYGERGYRFTLLEAGHQAQNLGLVATLYGLACVNVGGFRDREVDALLGMDGLQRSTIYLTCIGAPEDA